MPLPRFVARFDRVVTNRVSRLFAGQLPGFAIVSHTGRRSGRRYRTPVNLFRSADGYVIALTHGARGDWVKNVLAAGGCEVETQGVWLHLKDPRILIDRRASIVPAPVRPILKGLRVTQFLALKREARPS